MAERSMPISEAAKIMGTSVDAMRKRVQRRSVKAYKGSDGQWRVVLDDQDFDIDGRDFLADARTTPGTSSGELDATRHAGSIMAVQEMLAPFIAELGTVREELGREKEKREQLERERDQLRLEVARSRSTDTYGRRVDSAAYGVSERPTDDESPARVPTPDPSGVQREIGVSQRRGAWLRRLFGGE